ncbi:hypothetical protein ACFQS3_11090 [Glycomyces mayteni]|uniref:Lipoprotein n=1 Tax=Glycomyces mayteni TaxID=543887 RepID=A0ABW2D8A8_9ACTN|nr:hypothetical protein GCM10025732_32400 [Glycomyces mayteni]
MSIRSMSALALGALTLLAGCNDAGDADAAGEGDASDQSPAEEQPSPEPTPTTFDEFPGEELLYFDAESASIGTRIKAVGTEWTTEFLDYTAEAGTHYLVIYVVATGELDDRGLDHAGLSNLGYTLEMRYPSSASPCLTGHEVDDPAYCYYDGWNTRILSAQFEPFASDDWTNYLWMEGSIFGVEMEPGATMVGAVAFSVEDEAAATGGFEFCARGKDNTLDDNVFPCIAAPDPAPIG